MLDFTSPFTYIFRDKAWLKKFLLASLLTYTIIGADPVGGWMVEIARRVGKGEAPELPEWRDWGAFWKEGTQFLGANVLWVMPLVPAVILVYLPLLLANRVPDVTLLVVWGATAFCVLVFLLVYSFVYLFVFPALMVRLVRTGQTWAAANPVSLWKEIRPHFVEYLLVFLIVGLGLVNVVLVLSIFTLFLLLPPLLVYLGLVTAHFAGQLVRRDD